MDKKGLKELNRLLPTLSEEEAKEVLDKYHRGEPTGYATVDRPWDKFYENVPKRELFIGTTPYSGLKLANEDYPEEEALHYFGSDIKFKELFKNIEFASKSLEEYGIKKGDFVTICSTTTPEVIYLFYAISKIGAIANVISPFYEPEELVSRINECESKLIIVADNFYPKFKEILNKDKRKNVIVLPIMNSSPLRFITKSYKVDPKTNETPWKHFIKNGYRREETIMDPYEQGKPQAMVYSSGSTGPSKGILLSVDSFQKVINAYGNSGFDTSRRLKVYQNIPPWFSTGLSLGINFPLSFGVKVYTDPRFEHDPFIRNVLHFQPEYILTDTSMYQAFAQEKYIRKLKGKSLSFIKYPVEGGELLTFKDVQNVEGTFRTHGSDARLLNGYGQCECGATVTTDITSNKFANNASGIPLPEITTVGIFDDDHKELKYGERGNILVKTEIGMIGYFNRPEKTAEYFYIDSNGERWGQTGDIGYMNTDGSLVVLGRKIDFSVINGEQIYNFDIENAILKSKLVKQCVVKTHPDNSNVLVAHIIWDLNVEKYLKQYPEKRDVMLSEIQEIVQSEMGTSNAVPYYFCIRKSFPIAKSGKKDTRYIQNNIEDIIKVNKPKIKIK